MRIITLVAFLAVAAFAASASAGEGCGHEAVDTVQHIFSAADADQDGSLTRSEYEDAGLDRYGVSFEETDGDGDGRTSFAEYLELYERHHPRADETEA